jgi:hypothetical protein
MKSFIMVEIFQPTSSGRTNLFHLPKYFRKGEGERKGEQKRGRKRQFNPTEPIFLWMTPYPATLRLSATSPKLKVD